MVSSLLKKAVYWIRSRFHRKSHPRRRPTTEQYQASSTPPLRLFTPSPTEPPTSPTSTSMNPPPQLSLLSRARRRRKIRTVLDEVARRVSEPQVDQADSLALFAKTDCAVLTDTSEIIVTKTASARPFDLIAPKIRALRASSAAMCEYLHQPPLDFIHLRGHKGLVLAYTIGQHTLIVMTEVNPDARNLDTDVDRIDRFLRIADNGPSLVAQLTMVLQEF